MSRLAAQIRSLPLRLWLPPLAALMVLGGVLWAVSREGSPGSTTPTSVASSSAKPFDETGMIR